MVWSVRLWGLFMKYIFFSLLFTTLASAAPEPPAAPKVPIVYAGTVKAADLFDVLSYPARITPAVNASLLSEADGIVHKVFKPLGRPVKRGEKILTIKNTDPIYDFAPLAVAAPVSGVVSSIDVAEGSRVVKGQKLATILDPKDLKILIEVSAFDISTLQPGLNGELMAYSFEKPVAVKILGVSPYVDPATGSATAELKALEGGTLVPGMVGRVTFKARQHIGIEVPESAISYRGQEAFIRLVEEGKAKFQRVELGQSRRGMVEVLKGLAEGSTFILRANGFVSDGETVTVELPEGPKA